MSARRFLIGFLLAIVLAGNTFVRAQQRPLWMKGAHTAPPTAIAVSLDGATIVTGAGDSVVRVWNRASGNLRHIFHGHRTAITGVAISPDGDFVASTSGTDFHGAAGEIRLWNLASSSGVKLKVQGRNEYGPVAVAFSPDGSMLAVANMFGIDLYFMPDGRPAGTLINENAVPMAVAFSPDGHSLATTATSWAGGIVVWDLSKRDPQFMGSGSVVTSVMYSDDGASLVVSSGQYGSGAITLHDAHTGRTTDSIGGMYYPPHGARLSRDRRRVLFRTEWGLHAIDLVSKTTIDSITCDPETPIIFNVSTESLIGATMLDMFEWRPLLGSSVLSFAMHGFDRGAIPIAPDDGSLAVRSGDSIRFLETSTGRELGAIHAISESARFTASGEGIVTVDSTAYRRSSVRRRVIKTGDDDSTLRLRKEFGSYQWYIAAQLSPDARLAALAETSGGWSCAPPLRSFVTIHELYSPFGSWRLDSGATELMFVERTVFSRDGSLIAGSSRDSVLRVWSVRTGELLDTLRLTAALTTFEFDSDGRHVIVGTDHGTITIYEIEGLRLVRSMDAHRGPVTALVTSSNGRVLISGGADGTIRSWHFPDGSNARTMMHGTGITSLALTTDMRHLVVTGADATVAMFDAVDVRDMSASVEPVVAFSRDAVVPVWPNPASDEIHVRLPASDRATIVITDAIGAVVARYETIEGGGEIVLDVRELSCGLYRIRVEMEDGSESSGFAIVR
jgi:WD40 repeat protein